MSLRNFKRDVALLTIGSAFEKTQAARTLACHGAADCDAADAIVAAGAIDPLVALVTNGAAGGQEQAARALNFLAGPAATPPTRPRSARPAASRRSWRS